jgi:integrase
MILAECPDCWLKQANKNKRCQCGCDLDKAKKSRRVKYYVGYREPGHKNMKKTCVGYSLDDARTLDGKYRALKRERPATLLHHKSKLTFSELIGWYLGLKSIQSLAMLPAVEAHLGRFKSAFGSTKVISLRKTDLENFQSELKAEGLSDSYVDQIIGSARSMVRKAFDDEMLGEEALRPFRLLKKLLKKSANVRNEVLSHPLFLQLQEGAPEHLRPILATAYYTGMRRGEILQLTWPKVDLDASRIVLAASDTKDGEPRTIPLPEELLKILKALPRVEGQEHVFLFRGLPLVDIRDGFRRACAKAGIPYGRNKVGGLTFHDLRHTYVTNMRRAGVAESVIMKITGHSTREMFDRYNFVDEADAEEAMEQFRTMIATRGIVPGHESRANETKSDQPANQDAEVEVDEELLETLTEEGG